RPALRLADPEHAAALGVVVNETHTTEAEVTPEDGRAWYIVQTYSGYENKVKTSLEQRVKTMDMSNKIFQVIIPTAEEIEIKDGPRKAVWGHVFPGAVVGKMSMADDAWSVARNAPAVTGFAGATSDDRAKPTPLPDAEVDQILRQMTSAQPRVNVGFQI